MKFFAAIAAFAAVASAIQITEPKVDSKLDFSKSNTIKWTAVDTDPEEFSISLIDSSTSPENAEVLVSKVKTDDKEYTFENVVAKPGKQYKIKFISIDKQNTGQLAESQTFEVTKSGVKASSTTPAPTSAPTGTGTEQAPASSSSTGGAIAGAVGVAGPIAALLAFLV